MSEAPRFDLTKIAVVYLRQGAPGIPIWLFSTVAPDHDTEALCEHVEVRAGSLALLLRAERALWPYWLALGVTAWTGESGRWPIKWAPGRERRNDCRP